MNEASEESMLIELFRSLGASPEQSLRMASQTLKRVGQLAEESGASREDAMARMLRLIVAGRAGELPDGIELGGDRKT